MKYIPDRYSSVLVPRGRLWDLAEHLGKFRREGKNRRDNAAGNTGRCINNVWIPLLTTISIVSSRVLRLAHELAEENGELSANQKNLQKKMAKAKL